jgi:exodeoxyribonuclease III
VLFRIATWNVNSLRMRQAQLLGWLERARPDVLALQETKLPDEAFPAAELLAAGYASAYSGQKSYNGVATLVRTATAPGPLDAVRDMPGYDDPQRRMLAVTVAGVRVVNVYVPNGQSVESDKYYYKLGWLRALRGWLRQELSVHPLLVVLGDFNVAPEDRDVHDPVAWLGSVLVSPEERAALRTALELGLVDVFRKFEQPPRSFSWWDYRAGAVRRNEGLRIDLLLASAALAGRCTACEIDREPRLVERASDHTPVIATFDI